MTTVTYFKQRFPVSTACCLRPHALHSSEGREVGGSKLFYGIDEAWLVGNGEDGGQGGGVDAEDEDGEDPPTTQNKTSWRPPRLLHGSCKWQRHTTKHADSLGSYNLSFGNETRSKTANSDLRARVPQIHKWKCTSEFWRKQVSSWILTPRWPHRSPQDDM